MKRIDNLSERLNIPVWRVKEAFGIPLIKCEAASLDEAMDEYHSAPDDSEEERAAILRCIELCVTPEDAQTVFDLTRRNSDIQRKAFQKWDELSLAAAKKAVTPKEAEISHNFAPENSAAEKESFLKQIELCCYPKAAQILYNSTQDNSEEEAIALGKWDDLSLLEVQKAGEETDPKEKLKKLKAACDGAPNNGRAQQEAIRQMSKLV